MPRTPDHTDPSTAEERPFLSLEDLLGPPIEFELSDIGAGDFTPLPDEPRRGEQH